MPRTIDVTWHTGSAAGYTDRFPIEEFEKEVKGAVRLHRVLGPKSGEYNARYRLDVAGRTATLNYEQCSEFNVRNGMELGIMTFEFADSKRTEVKVLRWNGDLMKASDATVVTRDVHEPVALGEIVSKKQQKLANQVLRPGQAEFRTKLDRIYGSQCCVSQCPVAFALEAAHITPFADDTTSNAPSNGLLLRADLHRLFDAGQLAIQPKTHLVYFAREALSWSDYEQLHKQAKLAHPQPGFTADAPSETALEKRWVAFVDTYGVVKE